MPFSENTIDIILNVESSHLYNDINRFLKEVMRVLKPGGYLCWADLRENKKVRKERLIILNFLDVFCFGMYGKTRLKIN